MTSPWADRTAAESLVDALVDQLDTSSVENIVAAQRESLARYEKTNEMLTNCCSLSANRLETAKRELVWNTQLINDMKKDLDSIFRRIRAFKNSLIQYYPNAFVEEKAEGEEEEKETPGNAENSESTSDKANSST